MRKRSTFVFIALAVCVLAMGVFGRKTGDEEFPLLNARPLEHQQALGGGEAFWQGLLALNTPKHPPGPHDWLARHPEPGETFEQYVKSRPRLPDEERKFIYITRLGAFDAHGEETLERVADYVGAFFGLPVSFSGDISLDGIPPEARRFHPQTQDPQILTNYVIEELLKPRVPQDGFCLIAFTPSDLWPGEGWNFVFGQASLLDRVGVWSFYRNGDPSQGAEARRLFLERAVKTGVHEIGHMFSLRHCVFFECVMNGSNHRREADGRPLWLCPVCLRKLHWALGFDLVQRYRELLSLSEAYGFEEAVSFYRGSLQALLPVPK